MPKYLLEVKNLSKQLMNSFKLDSIHLNLLPQEVHVLMGANGSGKSALAKILSGIITDYSGNITLDGTPITIRSVADAKAHGIFYVPQDIQLFDKMSVTENLFFEKINKNSKFTVIDMDKFNFETKQLLDEFGINMNPHDILEHYGLAQKHIIQILKAYVSDAKIIIFDEPSASFSDYETDILHTIISKLKNKSVGILLISHRISDVYKLGSRVSIMKQGSLIATLDVKHSVEQDIIALLSGGPLSNRYPKLNFKKGPEILKVNHLNAAGMLTDISFSLHKHEVLGITGLAGSGRTLLANCLFGNTKYECSLFEVNGIKTHIAHPLDAISNAIALLPEDKKEESIIPSLNVADNVAFTSLHRFSQLSLINYDMLLSAVKDYFKRFNIKSSSVSNNRVDYYPSGLQQKMLFAKWIMNGSKIFILDEPTRGVDIPNKIDIYNCINNITKNGGGVILISSDFDEILGMSDRILVLSQGRLVCEMTQKQASKEKILHYATSAE